MKVDPRIAANIRKIREYTQTQAVLREQAHHFLYDKRYNDAERIRYVVMGVNPGEPSNERNQRGDVPLEETSLSDFLCEGIDTPGAKRWRDKCRHVCGTLDIALTEAIFWSSRDLAVMRSRYGVLHDELLRFAVPLNRELIQIHSPTAVVCVGMVLADILPGLYGLSVDGAVTFGAKGGRLIVPFRDKDGRPWIVMKHWSARLSNSDKDAMRDYLWSLA